MTIGKVQDRWKFEELLKSIKVPQSNRLFEQWPSFHWVRDAIGKVNLDREENRANKRILGTSFLDWKLIRVKTMAYADIKVSPETGFLPGQRRTFGQIPTFDLLEGKETEE